MRKVYAERAREWVAGGLRGECVALANKFRARSAAERAAFVHRANAARAAGLPSWKAMQYQPSRTAVTRAGAYEPQRHHHPSVSALAATMACAAHKAAAPCGVARARHDQRLASPHSS